MTFARRPRQNVVFVTDQEKAALAGISVAEVAETVRVAVGGDNDQTVRVVG